VTVSTAGYSGTPLAKKLGIADGARVAIVGAPAGYRGLLEPLPARVTFVDAIDERCDLVHLFTTERATLAAALADYRKRLAPDAVVWASWPKKASKMATDITEDVIRAVALPLGFVDVKVCAVDETWSGLKLVVRRALR
jgi:hypothetical protein